MGPKPKPELGKSEAEKSAAIQLRNRALCDEELDHHASLEAKMNNLNVQDEEEDEDQNKEKDLSSSLHERDHSVNHDGDMSQQVNNNSNQPFVPWSPQANKKDELHSTPATGNKVPVGHMESAVSITQVPSTDLQSPSKKIKTGSALNISSPISSLKNIQVMNEEEDNDFQHAKMKSAVTNPNNLAEALEAIKKHQNILKVQSKQLATSARKIGRVFPPQERKQADPLMAACRELERIGEFLEKINKGSQSSSSSSSSSSSLQQDSTNLIRFKLGMFALSEKLSEINKMAGQLKGKSEYSTHLGTQADPFIALGPIQQNINNALADAHQPVSSSSSLPGLSFSTENVKREFLQENINQAAALLEQGKKLTVSTRDEESIVSLAAVIFQHSDDSDALKELNNGAEEVAQKLILLDTIQKKVSAPQQSTGGSSMNEFYILALTTAKDDASQAIEQLKCSLQKNIENHQDSWGIEATNILDKIEALQNPNDNSNNSIK